MKLVCVIPDSNVILSPEETKVVLYGRSDDRSSGEIGATIKRTIYQKKLCPSSRAWDLLTIALSVIAADLAGRRTISPDGWTRRFELRIAVSEPIFWTSQKKLIEQQLAFLTTDVWSIDFFEGNTIPRLDYTPIFPETDCVTLLSGGLDSLIGTLDLVAQKLTPYAVSQIVRGDADKQKNFASVIGNNLQHIQFNHKARLPNSESSPSQRARSIIFLTYGVVVATALKRYHEGQNVSLYICENGYISINPPLTGIRLGSLSTRTTHPVFLSLFQKLLDTAGIRVDIENPYRFHTKGEMLLACKNQDFLLKYAHETTSCGRYQRFGYKHCGRCVPCLVRRAAFQRWEKTDLTHYVYQNLALDNSDYARFDDVRAVGMAVAEVKSNGLDVWLGASLSSTLIQDTLPYKEVVRRGLDELGNFLDVIGVR